MIYFSTKRLSNSSYITTSTPIDDIEQPKAAAINQFMSDLQSVSPIKLFDNF